MKGRPLHYFEKLIFIANKEWVHWQVIVVYPSKKRIECIDSMNWSSFYHVNLLFRMLYDDSMYFFKDDHDRNFFPHAHNYGWSVFPQRAILPTQEEDNTYDCGIYALTMTQALLMRKDLTSITPQMIASRRKEMFLQMLNREEEEDIGNVDYEALMLTAPYYCRARNDNPWGTIPPHPPDLDLFSGGNTRITEADQRGLVKSHGKERIKAMQEDLLDDQRRKEKDRFLESKEKFAERAMEDRDTQMRIDEIFCSVSEKNHVKTETLHKKMQSRLSKVCNETELKKLQQDGKTVERMRDKLTDRLFPITTAEESDIKKDQAHHQLIKAAQARVAKKQKRKRKVFADFEDQIHMLHYVPGFTKRDPPLNENTTFQGRSTKESGNTICMRERRPVELRTANLILHGVMKYSKGITCSSCRRCRKSGVRFHWEMQRTVFWERFLQRQ